jgi:hypothetical protein
VRASKFITRVSLEEVLFVIDKARVANLKVLNYATVSITV